MKKKKKTTIKVIYREEGTRQIWEFLPPPVKTEGGVDILDESAGPMIDFRKYGAEEIWPTRKKKM